MHSIEGWDLLSSQRRANRFLRIYQVIRVIGVVGDGELHALDLTVEAVAEDSDTRKTQGPTATTSLCLMASDSVRSPLMNTPLVDLRSSAFRTAPSQTSRACTRLTFGSGR